jgi:murein L,D-transpeptidase YcbB/YkuD
MEKKGGSDSIPDLRQLPGDDNPLGRIKFLFPNRYDIYLHDTPNKGVFEKDKRAVSHGCIRLADAPKLATFLLQNEKDWTPEKVQSAMKGGKELTVKLADPVPVRIVYLTAWVDEKGQLNFRNDIYHHDELASTRLFMTGG